MGIITTDHSAANYSKPIFLDCDMCGFVRKCIISQILFQKMCKCEIDDRDVVGLKGDGTRDR